MGFPSLSQPSKNMAISDMSKREQYLEIRGQEVSNRKAFQDTGQTGKNVDRASVCCIL